MLGMNHYLYTGHGLKCLLSDQGAFQFVAHKIEIDSINQSERKLLYQRLQAAKELHGLKHENILKYEGSFIKDRTLYVLNAYAIKGSILDVFDSYKGEYGLIIY